MGKFKKSKSSSGSVVRNAPLEEQLYSDCFAKPTGRSRERHRTDEDEFVDAILSRKILDQARKQQEDLEEEHGHSATTSKLQIFGPLKKHTEIQPLNTENSDEDSDELDESADQSFYDHIDIDDDDEKALQIFMNDEPVARRTLADIIMEKLAEKKTEIRTQFSDGESVANMDDVDPRVAEMYKAVGKVLSHYRSGKLPKAFKVIPNLINWEQILFLTQPEKWTAAAMYQATRIFASNLKEKMAQRFFNLVLLPRVRDDIAEYKKLNSHLYLALKKALFKPGAFFKGILLPICESKSCTLREAVILSSVVATNSIPVLHSSAALLKIAEMEYTGASSIFMRVLLDKKYALPYRVIDAIVFHFLGFRNEKRELPVLWHQAFLVFVQRYKEDLSSEQKEALLGILRIQVHHQITAEIRREIQNSKSREEAEGARKEIVLERPMREVSFETPMLYDN